MRVMYLLCCGLVVFGLGFPSEIRAEKPVDFARDVLPILSDNCFLCHGPDAGSRKADLRLDTQADALRTENPVILPGKSHDSELLIRILSTEPDEVMPPPASKKSLTPEQIDILKRWIDAGAPWAGHWAFEPVTAPVVPVIPADSPILLNQPAAIRNPIDAFVLAKLAESGFTPTAEADRETLIRRATLALTGLPPTLAEIDAFLADPAPEAYETVVDRLLASPRYGERMVWDWLEAARYADSNGYQGDGERTMWPWRDWAVNAFNTNQPFDQFTIEQLAGDLLPNATHEQKLATGFQRNHMINGEGGRIAAENRVDYVMDMAETTGTVWMGLTFNCCRCHDHKFDPLLQKDYYQLFAFFNNTPVDGGGGNPQTAPVLEISTEAERARLSELNQQITTTAQAVTDFELTKFPRDAEKTAADSDAAKDLPDGIKNILKLAAPNRARNQIEELVQHFKDAADYVAPLTAQRNTIDARDGLSRSFPRVMIMEELAQPREVFILNKGLYNKPEAKVGIGVPERFPQLAADAPQNRLGLARWLMSPENPLTARVIVNRYWQQFFRVGLVKTSEDFGVQGERPLHPELLDWLATEFRHSGWNVKQLVRLIVTSGTFRQSSAVTPEFYEKDPENRYLARGPRYRLPAWMIRDQALAASGLLVGTLGGPPVKPYQPTGIWEEATFGNKRYEQDHGEKLYRRSLYTFWRRIVGPSMFFDTPSRQFCTVKQAQTNTPLHALTTLNDVTYTEAARVLAQHALEQPGDEAARLRWMFRTVLGRAPVSRETELLLQSLVQLREDLRAVPDEAAKIVALGEAPPATGLDLLDHAAWSCLCSVLLNSDEALTIH